MARDPLLCRKFYFFKVLPRQRRPIFVEVSQREHNIKKDGANIRDTSISEENATYAPNFFAAFLILSLAKSLRVCTTSSHL